jgi:chromatin assembly factor 1 subunit A
MSIAFSRLLQEKERLEKRAAKIEKDQKAKEAQSKSQSIMASFFAKAKPAPSAPSPSRKASSSTAEFDKVFKPFVLKKDAVLAPTNWFKAPKRSGPRSRSTVPESAEVIVIDEEDDSHEDIEMLDNTVDISEAELCRMSDQG